MEDTEKIKEYVLKRYPRIFKKKEHIKNYRGQTIRIKYIDIEPLITIGEKFIEIRKHIDAGPIFLSKNILNERI
tara:strand:+ start:698 stop:919 length:222 start_codon:yes stop_codon:yes gene_type:complete